MTPEELDKWNNAQREEMRCHLTPFHEARGKYLDGYTHCCSLLDIQFDLNGKSIIEIGPGPVALLSFCKNFKDGYIIEPLEFTEASGFYGTLGIKEIKMAAEVVEFPKVDEVWIINVLQHVIHPSLIVEKAQAAAPCVKYLEPINWPTDEKHLFSFNMADFEMWFDKPKLYKGKSIRGFHEADCAYGVWTL